MTIQKRHPDRRERHAHRDDEFRLTSIGGLAALSLDALSSVAYGPQAVVLALAAAAGASATSFALPIMGGIAALLLVLVISYRQVIAVHPDGGGAYAVARRHLGRPASLLAAASLVVDYVLTVSVSLAAGAASLGNIFPLISRNMLVTTLIALVALTALNLAGIAESAKVLLLPTAIFLLSVFAVIVVGLFHSHPVALVGSAQHFPAATAVGVVLLVKAFAAGCASLTGVEAIANGVPEFRSPAVARAQRTEVALGVLLGAMLLGLAVLIRLHHVAPRGGVTVLAQLAAGAFGTGWPYYVVNLAVAVVLGVAANTSFGGLPVLLNLLARDDHLPHLFTLRAERPVFRFGIATLGVLAAIVLVIVGADTDRLLPLFAVGVFTGFTISQTGLTRHWLRERGPRWRAKTALNGFGAVLTGTVALVLLISKFTAGAWLLLLIVPILIALFHRVQRYYRAVAEQIGLGRTPEAPAPSRRADTVVIVPVANVSDLTTRAINTAERLGDRVVPVTVRVDRDDTDELCAQWDRWRPGVSLTVLPSIHRSVVTTLVHHVRDRCAAGDNVVVLLPQLRPRKRFHQLLHNQRVPVLSMALHAHTDAVVAGLVMHID
ncbi:APC family permease [Nocardia alni]|uniref:APC family permease n=1 Tax=Nocardia alni TaxID=2815723 RepID=UPI0027E06218|nr:APC family permease [Nocardia alni]